MAAILQTIFSDAIIWTNADPITDAYMRHWRMSKIPSSRSSPGPTETSILLSDDLFIG